MCATTTGEDCCARTPAAPNESSASSTVIAPAAASAFCRRIAARSQLVSQMLVECNRQVVPFQVDLFNQSHGRLWDATRDFLACHYRFNLQLSTPFWQHCRSETDIGRAGPMVEYYQEFGPTGM